MLGGSGRCGKWSTIGGLVGVWLIGITSYCVPLNLRVEASRRAIDMFSQAYWQAQTPKCRNTVASQEFFSSAKAHAKQEDLSNPHIKHPDNHVILFGSLLYLTTTRTDHKTSPPSAPRQPPNVRQEHLLGGSAGLSKYIYNPKKPYKIPSCPSINLLTEVPLTL